MSQKCLGYSSADASGPASLLLVAAGAVWFYGEGARAELAIAVDEIGAFGFHAGELEPVNSMFKSR